MERSEQALSGIFACYTLYLCIVYYTPYTGNVIPASSFSLFFTCTLLFRNPGAGWTGWTHTNTNLHVYCIHKKYVYEKNNCARIIPRQCSSLYFSIFFILIYNILILYVYTCHSFNLDNNNNVYKKLPSCVLCLVFIVEDATENLFVVVV